MPQITLPQPKTSIDAGDDLTSCATHDFASYTETSPPAALASGLPLLRHMMDTEHLLLFFLNSLRAWPTVLVFSLLSAQRYTPILQFLKANLALVMKIKRDDYFSQEAPASYQSTP